MNPAARSMRHGLVGLCDGMAALVEGQDCVIQALHAHLYFGHTQRAQPGQFFRRHLVGAGLDGEAHIPVSGVFVEEKEFVQPFGGRFDIFPGREVVHGFEAALDKPCLIVAFIRGEGAPQDEQFDLVGGMAH